MKEAVTKEDKMNMGWTEMQRILASREVIKWLMAFLSCPGVMIIIALTNQTIVDYLFSYLSPSLDFWILQSSDYIIHSYILSSHHNAQHVVGTQWMFVEGIMQYIQVSGYVRLTRMAATGITNTEDILRKQLIRWFDGYRKYVTCLKWLLQV